MGFGFKQLLKGIRLVPVSSTGVSQKGDIELLDSSSKINFFNGTTASPLVAESHAATLTNKIIDADLNTITNIENADIKAGAAIDYSKLNLVNSIVNADINASAAIAYSKLNLVGSIVNADVNAAAAIAYSKLNLVGSIINADINATAAIARTKIASGTAYRILANNSSGVMSENAALTAAHVIFADANGQLSGEQFLSKSRGGSAQDNSSITFPASGVLVTTTGTQTLSNKSFSDPVTLAEIATPSTPASGNGKIYFKSDGFLYQLNDDGTETKVGAGSGGINYITNGDAESNTTGWAAYADAAGSTPVDGTGGAPTVTITRSTSSPLRGTGSFLITKDAANRQGEGASYDFTIADADKAKPLSISFNYNPSSGFTAGDSSDIRIYLYDVTNALVIQPAPFTIQGGSGANQRFISTFQTSSNSNSYRLIFHVATTSSTAYTFKFDDVQLGPQSIVYGSPISDKAPYIPTGSFTTNTTYTGQWSRNGDSLEGEILVAFSGAPGGGPGLSFTPSQLLNGLGLSLDTSKIAGYNAANDRLHIVGSWEGKDSGVQQYGGELVYEGLNNYFILVISSGGTVSNTGPFTIGSNDTYSLKFKIPILGWSSTVQMSNDTDTRVVAARYRISSNKTTTAQLDYDTKVYDTHSSVTTGSSWKFTAPVSGYYRVSVTSVTTVGVGDNLGLFKNGTVDVTLTDLSSNATRGGSQTVFLNAGDFIDVRPISGISTTFNSASGGIFNEISIERQSGPSAIAASEVVSMGVQKNSGSHTSSGSEQDVTSWSTPDYDSHGGFNSTTGVYTVPSAGVYSVCGSIAFTGNTTGVRSCVVQQNGSRKFAGSKLITTNADQPDSMSFSGQLKCMAGDTIKVRAYQSSGGSLTYEASNNYYTTLFIKRNN